MNRRWSSVAVSCMVFGLIAASTMGCRRSRARAEATQEEPVAPVAQTLTDRFPSSDPVLGSKSYPLRLITTENMSGRIKEGGASNSWPFTLIDARTRVEFESEHLPGAINCPAEQVEQRLPTLVPDRTRELVFYCNGPNCTKSHKAGRSATAAGYNRVVVYDEGLPAWRAANLAVEGSPLPKVEIAKLDPAALNAALKTKSITVVDIRPRDEFLVFRIAGALNISLDDLEAKLKSEVKPNTALCLADYTGHQQEVAGRLLTKLGYTNVKMLDGGMRGWQTAKLPVEKGIDVTTTDKVADNAKPATKGAAAPVVAKP